MGLELEKTESALRELRDKGSEPDRSEPPRPRSTCSCCSRQARRCWCSSRSSRIPYPILLVLGGLALGFVPGLPEIDLPPDLVLVGVLPPLLYGAAFFTSLRDLRANLRPIGLLAVGLVLADDGRRRGRRARDRRRAAVGGGLRARRRRLPDRPDRRDGDLQPPRRAAPDRRRSSRARASSTTARRSSPTAFAVVAAVSGTFSLWEAAGAFVLNVVGGIAVGLGVGWIVRQVRRRLDYPPAEVTISLLTGYFAYIPAELLGVSAVIAAVTVGIYMGWYTPELTTPEVRLHGRVGVWEIVTFMLNALLFTLIGLQLPGILDELCGVLGHRPALVGGRRSGSR